MVTLVAKKEALDDSLLKLVQEGSLAWFNRDYQPKDFDGKSVVLNFTGNAALSQISKGADLLYFDSSNCAESKL